MCTDELNVWLENIIVHNTFLLAFLPKEVALIALLQLVSLPYVPSRYFNPRNSVPLSLSPFESDLFKLPELPLMPNGLPGEHSIPFRTSVMEPLNSKKFFLTDMGSRTRFTPDATDLVRLRPQPGAGLLL
jgi:hypothetical protein